MPRILLQHDHQLICQQHGAVDAVQTNRFNSALSLAKSFDIRGVSDSMPRRCGRQTTRVNHSAETQKQY
jgi:hypothetical protein